MDQIAVISDIHGNIPALQATLHDIQLRKIGRIFRANRPCLRYATPHRRRGRRPIECVWRWVCMRCDARFCDCRMYADESAHCHTKLAEAGSPTYQPASASLA
jgi:hypothetical protein